MKKKMNKQTIYIATEYVNSVNNSATFTEGAGFSTNHDDLLQKLKNDIEEYGIYEGILDFTNDTAYHYDADEDEREIPDDGFNTGWLVGEFDRDDIPDEYKLYLAIIPVQSF